MQAPNSRQRDPWGALTSQPASKLQASEGPSPKTKRLLPAAHHHKVNLCALTLCTRTLTHTLFTGLVLNVAAFKFLSVSLMTATHSVSVSSHITFGKITHCKFMIFSRVLTFSYWSISSSLISILISLFGKSLLSVF